ncbi:hypothetical protein KC973_02805 [Candidatus Saccharibacteria bacterium]|nr:hypothetical protein [Candidatus Saccharibacteria bacterium]
MATYPTNQPEGFRMNKIEDALERAAQQGDTQLVEKIINDASRHPDSMVAKRLELCELRFVGRNYLLKAKGMIAHLQDGLPIVLDDNSKGAYKEYEDDIVAFLTAHNRDKDKLLTEVADDPNERTRDQAVSLGQRVHRMHELNDYEQGFLMSMLTHLGEQTDEPDQLRSNIVQTAEQVNETLWEVVHLGREAAVDMGQADLAPAKISSGYKQDANQQFEIINSLLTRAVSYLRGGDS